MNSLYEEQVQCLMESEDIDSISCSLPENLKTILIQCLKKSNKVVLLCKNVEEFGFDKKTFPSIVNIISHKKIDFKVLTKESFSLSKAKKDFHILSELYSDNIRIYNLPKDFEFDDEFFFSADDDKFFVIKTPEYSKAFFKYSARKELNDIKEQLIRLEKVLKLKRVK